MSGGGGFKPPPFFDSVLIGSQRRELDKGTVRNLPQSFLTFRQSHSVIGDQIDFAVWL
jgi:hypothetical protein